MVPSHLEKHFGVAALYRKVDVFAEVGVLGDVFEHLVGEVLWVGRGESETQVGEGFRRDLEKLAESDAWVVSELEGLAETLGVLVL